MMKIINLSFKYGARTILKDIQFSTMPGDFLCVLGPNGVGKSTLFRCMLGLNKGYEGLITIQDEDIKKLKPIQLAKKIAYIPQSHQPTFNFTVLNVVMMGLTAHLGSSTSPKKEHEEWAYAALEQIGISYLWNRGYGEISGGERQMTLIARALAQKASILIMDEPTANLDYGNQLRVLEEVRNLADEGYTIIMSTHNPEHAFMFGSQMIMMYKGQIFCAGSPKEQLTEELIEQVYGVNVNLHDIYNGHNEITVIVPKNIKGELKRHVYVDNKEHSIL